jgi:hypothetical protein
MQGATGGGLVGENVFESALGEALSNRIVQAAPQATQGLHWTSGDFLARVSGRRSERVPGRAAPPEIGYSKRLIGILPLTARRHARRDDVIAVVPR